MSMREYGRCVFSGQSRFLKPYAVREKQLQKCARKIVIKHLCDDIQTKFQQFNLPNRSEIRTLYGN
jgi:hypothetical protein